MKKFGENLGARAPPNGQKDWPDSVGANYTFRFSMFDGHDNKNHIFDWMTSIERTFKPLYNGILEIIYTNFVEELRKPKIEKVGGTYTFCAFSSSRVMNQDGRERNTVERVVVSLHP